MNKKYTLLMLAFLSFNITKTLKHNIYEFKKVPKNIIIKKINKEPAIYTLNNFITNTEAKKIIDIASPKMNRSMIDNAKINDYRTSSTAFLYISDDEIIKNLAERVASLIGTDKSYIEFQVVRYQKGQTFKQHHDFFNEEMMKNRKSQRLTTLFIYLNDLALGAGGETKFHHLGISVKPKKNTAVLWHNIDKNNERDYRTLHSGESINKGEKWAMNIWIHDQIPG